MNNFIRDVTRIGKPDSNKKKRMYTNEAHTKNSKEYTKHIFNTYSFIFISFSIWLTKHIHTQIYALTRSLFLSFSPLPCVYALTHSYSFFAELHFIHFYLQPVFGFVCPLWAVCYVTMWVCVYVWMCISMHAFWLAWIFFVGHKHASFLKPTQTSVCIAQAEKFQAPFFIKYNLVVVCVNVCVYMWVKAYVRIRELVYGKRCICIGDMFVRRMRWSRTLYFAFYTFLPFAFADSS